MSKKKAKPVAAPVSEMHEAIQEALQHPMTYAEICEWCLENGVPKPPLPPSRVE